MGQEAWRDLANKRLLETLLRAISVVSMETAKLVRMEHRLEIEEVGALVNRIFHKHKKKMEEVCRLGIFFPVWEELNYFSFFGEKSYKWIVNGLWVLGELIRAVMVEWKGSSDSH